MTEQAGLPETTVWQTGWLQVKIPLPFSLRWVNSYLVPDGDERWTVIDPGLHTPEAAAGWEAVLERQGIGFAAISRVLLTHQHPDHYGLAGWFQRRSGAPVLMSRASHAYARRMWGAERALFAEAWTAMYRRHGMPEELLADIGEHLESFVARVSPQPEVAYLEEGEPLRLAGMDWDVIHAPGHARGQLLYYQPEERLLFCGDQVLPRITPNISVVPGEDERPLRSFLDSLAELARLDVRLAFPGHRDPFTDFAARIEELQRHHARRLAELDGWLDEGGLTGYEACIRMFGERIGGNPHNLRFAMSEALAHLAELAASGRAREAEVSPDRIRFVRSCPPDRPRCHTGFAV